MYSYNPGIRFAHFLLNFWLKMWFIMAFSRRWWWKHFSWKRSLIISSIHWLYSQEIPREFPSPSYSTALLQFFVANTILNTGANLKKLILPIFQNIGTALIINTGKNLLNAFDAIVARRLIWETKELKLYRKTQTIAVLSSWAQKVPCCMKFSKNRKNLQKSTVINFQ